MKNSRLIAALLAATFILSAIPVHAQEPKKGVVRRSIISAKKQFNESLDRFKRCMRGRCTRWEALKVARDLGIAAAAVIAAMYVGGAGLRSLGMYTENKGYYAEKEGLIEIGEGMQRVGIGMQAPVTVSLMKLQLIAAQRRLPVGTKVMVPGARYERNREAKVVSHEWIENPWEEGLYELVVQLEFADKNVSYQRFEYAKNFRRAE